MRFTSLIPYVKYPVITRNKALFVFRRNWHCGFPWLNSGNHIGTANSVASANTLNSAIFSLMMGSGLGGSVKVTYDASQKIYLVEISVPPSVVDKTAAFEQLEGQRETVTGELTKLESFTYEWGVTVPRPFIPLTSLQLGADNKVVSRECHELQKVNINGLGHGVLTSNYPLDTFILASLQPKEFNSAGSYRFQPSLKTSIDSSLVNGNWFLAVLELFEG